MLCGCTNVAVSAGMVCCPHERKRADGKARVMDEKKVKCRECGKRATRYEGLLPTRAAVSSIPAGSVQLTFWLFAIVFAGLLTAEISILCKEIRKASRRDILADDKH